MRGSIDLGGIDRITRHLARYQPDDAAWDALGAALQKVIVEDNRKGVLAGLDRYGNPMVPVTYRTGRNVRTRFKKLTDPNFGTTAGRFKGRTGKLRNAYLWINEEYYRGSIAVKRKKDRLANAARREEAMQAGTRPNNNLWPWQYQELSGPPLAPRGEQSRVIANLFTETVRTPAGVMAVGAWKDVLSVKGVAFLKHHFRGSGRLPQRDLRGVRPQGRQVARRIVREWFRKLIGG